VKHTANFSDITIIESVDAGKSGRRLADDIAAQIAASERNLTVEYRSVGDANQFNAELKRLADSTRFGRRRPMIHLECHGSAEGIHLESGEHIAWNDLKPRLIEINLASRCNLLVVMAACYGAHLIATLDLTDRAPCWGFFGPPEEVSVEQLEHAYGPFYRSVISDKNPIEAAKKLLAPVDGHQQYLLMTAEVFFTELFARYLAHNCLEQTLHARAHAMAQKAIQENAPRKPGPGRMLRNLRKIQPSSFKKFAEGFFMVDLFPENAERFPVKYQEALAQAEKMAGIKLNVARAIN